MNGKGTLRYADGSIYDGCWKDDKRDGPGELKTADGARYIGTWKNDVRQGAFTVYYTSEIHETLDYIDDEPIRRALTVESIPSAAAAA